MAVQAQYPSNVLLLNRNVPEQKDAIFGGDYLPQSTQQQQQQQQQQGQFTHQSLLVDDGGVVNPRKRGREVTNSPQLFSLQPQNNYPATLPAMLNLAQIQNQNKGFVSTGLRLCSQDQQQHKQQQMGLVPPSLFSSASCSSSSSSTLTEKISAQITQQRDEIDRLIQTQADELRRMLAERRNRHYRALLGAAEELATRKLKEKEAEVENVAQRNAELEERTARLTAEAAAWRERARAQEAAAASLQARLQQAIMSGPAHDKRDELGCAEGEAVDDAESAHVDPVRSELAHGPMCRACQCRPAIVVVLPCRHLSLCPACNATVNACPLCFSIRSASVEVLLS